VIKICDESEANSESFEIEVSKLEKHHFSKLSEADVDMIMKSFLHEVIKSLEEHSFERFLENPDWEGTRRQFRVFFVTNSNERECSKLQEILIDRTIKLSEKKAQGFHQEAKRWVSMVDVPHLTIVFRTLN